jgi:hypothetical protein
MTDETVPQEPAQQPVRPLGMKAYGSIPHLPGSRRGPGDRGVTESQAAMCTERSRDRYDRVWVQVKLDGSNCSAALLDGTLVALTRKGNLAETSPFVQHKRWAAYVAAHKNDFLKVLGPGEWVSGEWLALAHGTRYDLKGRSPFVAFDIWKEGRHRGRAVRRLTMQEMLDRGLHYYLGMPPVVHVGGPLGIAEAMRRVDMRLYGELEAPEGAVWRVERTERGVTDVDLLAKYVRPGKVDGSYLHGEPVWNWRPLPEGVVVE